MVCGSKLSNVARGGVVRVKTVHSDDVWVTGKLQGETATLIGEQAEEGADDYATAGDML